MEIKIAVIGAGSWGTAIASLLAEKGYETTIWAREEEVVKSINEEHENSIFLPEIKLPENLFATNIMEDAVKNKDVVVMAVPSQFTRSVFSDISYFFKHGTSLVMLSKGIENGTLKFMNQVAEESLPDFMHKNIFLLSGPTFARELALKTPSAAVVASHNSDGIDFIQNLFATEYFRTYRSSDVMGVEIGGAMKNVIAIAVGILEGLGLGMNAKAALMTRAIAEISRLGRRLGANPYTMSGLSGVGDMILTCTGALSRNRQVGIKLGEGMKIKEILSNMKMVAEGVTTVLSAHDLARKIDVSMPITEAVYKIIHENGEVEEVFSTLMKRSLKDEFYGFS